MTFYIISTFVNTITCILVPFAVPPIQQKTLLAKSFSYYALNVFVWSFYLLCYWFFLDSKTITLFWAKNFMLGAVFIPATFFSFTIHFLNLYLKLRFFERLNYFLSTCFAILTLSNLMIAGVEPRLDFPYWPVAGPAYLLFVIYFLLIVLWAHILMLLKIKTESLQKRKQIQYIFLGTAIGFLGGATNFPLWFGIPLYPYGHILVSFYVLFTFLAIFKSRFLNMDIIIKQSLTYTIAVSASSLIFVTSIIILEKLFQKAAGYQSMISSTIAAILIALIFTPVKNMIQVFVDRLLLTASPVEIAEQNRLLRQEVAKSEHNKAIAALASGIAHEIKNPLTAVKTFTEYLPARMEDRAFLQNFSRLVGQEVGRIDDMVNQLLEFARPAPLAVRPTDMNRLINDTLAFLNSNFLKHHIQTDVRLDPGCDTPIAVDPNKIKQALLNILLNAVDAMADGGTLTVSTCRTPQNHIEITIADTGPGIAAEDLPHIFDPFFSKKDHGTGLGLSITQGIIQEHEGKISVATRAEGGTSFTILLSGKKGQAD